MPIQVSETGPCKRKVQVSIPADEVRQAVNRGWAEARRQVNLKGFRPGKVPQDILEKKFGPTIREEIKQGLVNDAFRTAIREHHLQPLRSPSIDLDQLPLDPAQGLEFELEFEIRPQFELPEYRGIEVGAPPVEVKPEDVDRELENLRGRYATYAPSTEGVARKGDQLTAEVSFRVDGAIVMNRENETIDTERDRIGELPAEGGTASFAGKEAGATVTVPVRLPDDFEPQGFAGLQAELLCTVKEIRRLTLPELDDAFVKEKFGADDLAQFRERLAEDYKRHLEQERNRYVENRVVEELISRTSFELPHDLLESAVHDAVHQLEHQLQHQGLSPEEAKANAAAQSQRVREEQSRALRATFLLDSIAEKEKISVTEAELEAAVRQIAMITRRDPQAVADELVESGRLYGIRNEIVQAKTRRLLREAAKITEAAAAP